MLAERGAPRVAIRTLGCKVNRADSEAIAEDLAAAGFLLVPVEEEADVIVVNTCTVTGEADVKARKAVRHALGDDEGGAPVVVTGCLASVDAAGVAALGRRVIVERDKRRVAGVVAGLASGAQPGAARGPAREAAVFRTRVTVKVQDGCDHRCAYCIVPDARGGPRSVPESDVVERVARLVEAGTREVVIAGINLGRFRGEAPDRCSQPAGGLATLLEAVSSTGVERIRISSIEPLDISERLLEVMSAIPAVLPHLHVPLQSGCDATLAAMGRGYDTAAFAEAVSRARTAIPGLALTTDVMAGFPGETAAEFAASVAFVGECCFAKLHVFRYSRRAGTPAASMAGQVEPTELARRAAVLRTLSEDLAARYRSARVGGRADVLVEAVRGGDAVGTSEDYLRVAFEAGSSRPGDVVPVVLRGGGGDVLRGARVVS